MDQKSNGDQVRIDNNGSAVSTQFVQNLKLPSKKNEIHNIRNYKYERLNKLQELIEKSTSRYDEDYQIGFIHDLHSQFLENPDAQANNKPKHTKSVSQSMNSPLKIDSPGLETVNKDIGKFKKFLKERRKLPLLNSLSGRNALLHDYKSPQIDSHLKEVHCPSSQQANNIGKVMMRNLHELNSETSEKDEIY